ncbi:MAG: hypothetical protein KF819_20035 [Labilithrix sp.]|nr:hypothetical protein [Labilithrix sp.]
MNAVRLLALASLLLACTKSGSGDAGAPAASDDAAPPDVKVAAGDDGGGDSGVLNATTLPAASVARMVNPESLPAYAGPTGVIEGVVTVTGDEAPKTTADFSRCPAAEKTWGRKFREGVLGPGGVRPLADAVVVVTGYKGFYVKEKDEAEEIRIEGCGYTARTVTMTFGQRLEVKNLSKDFWTPVLEPGSNMILMMAPPQGDPVKIYPKKPGHYLLVDRDRKYAVVDVYAFLHPLHAATTPTGYYRIEGVPVTSGGAKLKVSSMHPQFDATADAEVEVKAGEVAKVDLTLKYKTPPDAGAPKDAGPDAPYHPILR